MIEVQTYNLVFISTFIERKFIDNLIRSVVDNSSLTIYFIIVNQTLDKLELPNTDLISFHQLNTEKLSLSKARNSGIKYLIENDIHFEYIMFPDDDSTFDSDFFYNFNNVVGEKKFNYLIDVYGLNSKDLYIENKLADGRLVISDKPKMVMSVNMLINEKSFREVGMFDEKMGVGTEYGAGEDTDFFLRCVTVSGPFIYTKKLWNYHPKFEDKHKKFKLNQLINKYRNYGKGVIYLNVKHKLYFSAIELCINALGGSLIALFSLDFKLFIARLYAFFIRFYTFISLIIRKIA
ncbi:MAG: hypothetical protein PHR83_14110 [Paludibacter sp.]|nr:hypothetical protein [Paludibacter sp.]